jgi:hypothetical protein
MGMAEGKWSSKPNVSFDSKLWMISENSKVIWINECCVASPVEQSLEGE